MLVYELGDAPTPDYKELGCAWDAEEPNRVRWGGKERNYLDFAPATKRRPRSFLEGSCGG